MKIYPILAALTVLGIAGAANAATLHLTLDGVQPRGGKLLVAVQTRDQYMKPVMAGGVVMDGSASGTVHTDIAVPSDGDYAVGVLHDVDENWTMTMKDGKPAEGWSTVGAAKLRGKPTFEQVKIHVAGDTAVSETMIYPK